MVKTEAKYFHVKGRYFYYEIERVRYSVTIDRVVKVDDMSSDEAPYEAKNMAISDAMAKKQLDEYEEGYDDLDVEEVEPPPPPAEDAALWSMPRSVAPTLFPVEELST